MKTCALSLSLLAAVGLVSCAGPAPKSSSKAVALFNGRDLQGWRAVLAKPEVKLEEVWSVRDGLIVCRGEPLGYIQTEKTYSDFRLAVEWRWAPGKPPGNSGIFLRINGTPRPLPRCIETQLKSGDAGDLYAFHGMKMDGDLALRLEVKNHELGGDFVGVKKRAANEKAPGQWNRAEILVQGSRVTVWINGQKVNEAVDCEIVPGPIGLQSEGGEIHFRTVRLTSLDR